MTQPRRFLLRMLLFLVAVGVIAWILRDALIRTFWHNPVINGAILVTLALGLLFIFRQVFLLGREVQWLAITTRSWPFTLMCPSRMRSPRPCIRVRSRTAGSRVRIAGETCRPPATFFISGAW